MCEERVMYVVHLCVHIYVSICFLCVCVCVFVVGMMEYSVIL